MALRAWHRRTASQRAHEDASLTAEIEAIHRHSRGTYGAPRIHPELVARGRRVSRKRVARLMRAAHLRGVSRRDGHVQGCQHEGRAHSALAFGARCRQAGVTESVNPDRDRFGTHCVPHPVVALLLAQVLPQEGGQSRGVSHAD